MNKTLIIVIGLPGSGKTHLCQQLHDDHDYAIFDDFITYFFNNELVQHLQKGHKTCINDPRLCNPITFDKYINIFKQIIDLDQIHIVLFENNPESCIKNVIHRNKYIDQFTKNIWFYTRFYDLHNYQQYNHTIELVFDNSISSQPS